MAYTLKSNIVSHSNKRKQRISNKFVFIFDFDNLVPSSSNLKEIGSNENNTPDQKSIFCFSSSRTDVPLHGRSRQKLDPSQAVQIFPTSMTNADAFHSLPHVNKVPDLGGLEICSYTVLQGQNTNPLKHRYTENIPLLHGPCISESFLLNLGYYF